MTVQDKTRRRGGGEQPMVEPAEFRSYYGQPILNPPVWKSTDIPAYLYLGGLAGAGSVVAAGAHLTDRRTLATRSKVAAVGALALGTAALIHDLGKPSRFANMVRVFKPTSPMNMGSWLLTMYGPVAGAAALSDLTGVAPAFGAAATIGAAALGPAVASYTGALIADTAVPAWHDAHGELPLVFAASSAVAAAGLGLVTAPLAESTPVRRLAVAGAAGEVLAATAMEQRAGLAGETYRRGRAGVMRRASQVLTVAGVVGALLGRRNRVGSAFAGAALLGASAATKWSIFEAGMASARDPRYTVVPQRQRLADSNEADLQAAAT